MMQNFYLNHFKKLKNYEILLKPSDKKIFISSLLSKKVSQHTIDFITMVIMNKRELYIEDMLRNFLEMYRKQSGITGVTLTSTKGFSTAQKNTIISYIEKTYKTKVELFEKIDESLIGGFILRIEDLQYDASIKTKIQTLKQELLQSN